MINFEQGYNIQLHTCELDGFGGRSGANSSENPVLFMRSPQTTAA